MKAASEILELLLYNFPPIESMIEAPVLCLTCNNSIFADKYYSQTDVTAQGLQIMCSYIDLPITINDNQALSLDFNWSPAIWKRFHYDVFVVWTHGFVVLNFILV